MNKYLLFSKGFRNSAFADENHILIAETTFNQLKLILKFIVKQVNKKNFILYLDDKYKEKKFLLFCFKRIFFPKSGGGRARTHIFEEVKYFEEIVQKIKSTLNEVEMRLKVTHSFS